MVDLHTRHSSFSFGSVSDLTSGEAWDSNRLIAEIARRLEPLRKAGVGPGTRVVIAHGGRPAFFSDLFAVWELGGCAVCLDPHLTRSELQTICEYTNPHGVLVAKDRSPDLPLSAPALALECESNSAVRKSDIKGPRYPLDEPALILFTSGTTGKPKGVVHSFRSLLARIDLNRKHLGDEALARTLCVLPTHFGHGLIGNCLTALLSGHQLHLNCGGGIRIAADLRETIIHQRITFMSSVPAFWKIVLRLGNAPPPGLLRRVNVGSAPLSGRLWADIVRWSGTDNVSNMYGMTETANWFSGSSAGDRKPEDGLVGRPWGGTFGVCDRDGQVRTAGEGELLVRTPSLMRGYFRRDDLTAEVLFDGWYRTGDVGHIATDGTTHLTGRVKYEINRAGIKVQPEELDLLLETHEAVEEACAFGVPDEISGEAVAIAIRGTPGNALNAETLRNWCVPRIHNEAIPARWYFVDTIPKTERGKLNRELLRRSCLESNT